MGVGVGLGVGLGWGAGGEGRVCVGVDKNAHSFIETGRNGGLISVFTKRPDLQSEGEAGDVFTKRPDP